MTQLRKSYPYKSLELLNRVGELANPIRLNLHNITGCQRQVIRHDDARAGRDNRSNRNRDYLGKGIR